MIKVRIKVGFVTQSRRMNERDFGAGLVYTGIDVVVDPGPDGGSV